MWLFELTCDFFGLVLPTPALFGLDISLLVTVDHICVMVYVLVSVKFQYFGDAAWHRQHRELLKKCAATALSSKLVAHQKEFFANMVVDAVMMLDELLPLNMIGVKKIQGGALEVL